MEARHPLTLVRAKAFDLMGQVFDPFHDDAHAKEVETTAVRIYHHLPTALRRQAHLPSIRLLSVLHDTSRKIIGTNFLLEPLMGGYISGRIGYQFMIESGYPEEEARYIRGIIRNHESFLGLWHNAMDINGKVFSDADCVESYSLKRFRRGLKYFEKKKFSNTLLNIYIAGLIQVHRYARPTFYFDSSKHLCNQNVKQLRRYVLEQQTYFKKLLYHRIYQSFYSLDFFA